MRTFLAGLAGCLVLASCAGPQEPTLVTIAQGTLKGTQQGGILRYLDIPYAAPPVGELRWKAPQPAANWAGERDASAYGPECAQMVPPGAPQDPTLQMSEDCLTLNIWRPADAEGALPVMLWIHGGGHMFGTGRDPAFDGTEFAKKGVMLVTINYRLGPLGFMAHPELTAESSYGSSGNYGILDQIAALQWVQANIAKFGGDPGNVTIFGESAGSGAVNILQASPLAHGLFAKAIGESTSQFDPDSGLIGRRNLATAEEYGVEFAEKLGADNLAELRAMPANEVLSQFSFFWPTEEDGYVLPDLVYTTFAEGRQNDVPTLVGSNSDEGAALRMEWVLRDATADKATFDELYSGLDDPIRQSATDAVQWQARIWAQLQTQTGQQQSWLYWFDKSWPGRSEDGAFHGAEIVYVFQTLASEDQPWTEEDRALSRLMADYWVNFARTGNPNGEGLPQWPSYDPANPQLMRLAPDLGVISTPRPQAQQFLDSYFDARR